MMANWYKIPYNGTIYYYYASSPASAVNAMARDYGFNYTPNVPVEQIDASQVPSNILQMVGQSAPAPSSQPTPQTTSKPQPHPQTTTPAPTMEQTISTKANQYVKEATEKWQKFYDEWAKSKPEAPTPFSYDDALAEATKQIDAEGFGDYYKKLVDDYVKEGEIQKNEFLGRTGRSLADITNKEQYTVEKANDELKDALGRNDQGFAGRGLFFSGMRGKEQQKDINVARGALDYFMQGAERQKEELMRRAIERYGTGILQKLSGRPELLVQDGTIPATLNGIGVVSGGDANAHRAQNPYAELLHPQVSSILDKLANSYGSNYEGSYQRTLNKYKHDVGQQEQLARAQAINMRANELWNKYLVGTLQPYQQSLQEYYASKPQLTSYLSSGLGSLI